MPNTESGAGVERTRLVKAAPPEMFRPAALTVRQGYFWVQVAGLVRPWWRLLAVAARDPFSGRPFRYGRASGTLYSLGADAEDNGGRERLELWHDSDIAVPIRFVSGD